MATDPFLLERLRNFLTQNKIGWEEKKMFGGVCFMVDEKMCFGTFRNGLMVRVDLERSDQLLEREHASQMMQKERPMKGYLLIGAEGYDTENDLEFWVQECLDFNPHAKSSKKKK